MKEFERTHEIREVVGPHATISLHSVAADVTVRGVDGDEARIVLRYAMRSPDDATAGRIDAAFDAAVRRAPGSLEVRSVEGLAMSDLPSVVGSGALAALARAFGLASTTRMELQAELPRGTALSVETVSGGVGVSGIVGSQRYRTVSGGLRLVDVEGDVRIDTTSGSSLVESPSGLGLEWHSVSGDLRARAATLATVRLDSLSGDARLEGRLAPEGDHRMKSVSGALRLAPSDGLVAEVRTLSGGVHSELPHRVEGTTGRQLLVVGPGGPRLRFESMSGGLWIGRPVAPERRAAPAPVAPSPVAADPGPSPDATQGADASSADERLAILRAVERGEIGVDEAMRRLGTASRA